MFDILSQMRSESKTALEELAAEPVQKIVSTSSIYHKSDGICPKCSASMTVTKSHMDQVYFCPGCRVTAPLPDGQGC